MSRVSNGAALLFATKVIGSIISMASTIILARILVPEDYGLIAIASVGLALTDSLLNIPVGHALLRLDGLKRAHFDTAFTISLIRGLIVLIILLAISKPMAVLYSDDRLTNIIIVFGLITFIQSFKNPRFFLLAKELNYSKEVAIELFSRVVSVIGSIWFAITFQNYWALVVAPAIFGIVNTILSYLYHRNYPRLSLEKQKDILSFTNWLTLTEIINTIGLRIDTLMLGLIVNKSALGAYQLATDLVQRVITGFIEPISRPLFPQFSKHQSCKEVMFAQYLLSMQVIMTVSVPLSIGLAISSAKLIPLLLGDKWIDAVFAVKIFAFVSTILTLTLPSHQICLAMGKTQAVFKRQLIYLIVRLPVFAIFIYLYGVTGALYAKLIMSFYFMSLSLNMVKSFTSITIYTQIVAPWRCYISVTCMSLFYFLLVSYLETMHLSDTSILLLAIPSSASIYIIFHLALWHLVGRPNGSEVILLSFSKNIAKKTLSQVKR